MRTESVSRFIGFCLLISLFSTINTMQAQALFQGLNHPINSRGWGMGSAVCGLTNNGAGILSNPGTLSSAPPSLQVSYTSFVLDIYSTTGFAIMNAPVKGRCAVIVHYLDYGSFTERNREGEDTGNFYVNDLNMGIAYGTNITQKLSAGASVSFIHSNLNLLSANAILGSIGVLYYDSNSTLAVGFSYRNFGSLVSGYNTEDEPLPTTFIIGVSKHLAHLPMILSIDAYRVYKDEYVARIGGEFLFRDRFFLRWGTSTRRFQINAQQTFKDFLAGSSAGIGVKLNKFHFDIAFVSLGNIGTISSVSISQHL